MQPAEMRFGLVFLVSVAKAVFLAQPVAELAEPDVVGQTLTRPDRAGMVEVRLLVGILGKDHSLFAPMSRVEELGGFEDHLYDMLVAMIFRGGFGVEGKEEDVHCEG